MKTSDASLPPRTAWFEAASTPIRPGVYERRAPGGPFACWDGTGWHRDAESAGAAAREQGASAIQRAAWRGLVEASSAPCAPCRGHTVLDHGVDADTGADRIEECPDC
ncbi:MAG: hypothetical protein M3Z15_04640 [Pseudomonadota bacterium]|nr:hypothetical protein [Pseudomonadota bacterium]